VEIVLHLAKYGLMKLVPIYMFSVGAGTKTWKAWQGGVNLHCFFFSTHHFFVWNRVVWEWSNNKTMQSHTILRLAWYPLQCGNCFAPSQIWFNEIGTNLHVFSGGRYQNMNRLTRWCQFALFFFLTHHFFVWNRVVWEWSNDKTIQSHTMLRLAWYTLRGYKGYCSELIEVKVCSHTPCI
jgi:hypothetical protein